MSTLRLPQKAHQPATQGKPAIQAKPTTQAKPAEPAKTPPKPHPLEFAVGRRLVAQRGPVTYRGKLVAVTQRWLVFQDAEVIGTNRSVSVPMLWVNNDVNFISHFHEDVDAAQGEATTNQQHLLETGK